MTALVEINAKGSYRGLSSLAELERLKAVE